VKSFLSKAIHGGYRWAQRGTFKDVSMLDINSLYPYALTRILPAVGAPEVITESTDGFAYFIIEISIAKIAFGPGLLGSNLAKIYSSNSTVILDKTTLEDLTQYSTEFSWKVVRGYGWKTVSEEAHKRISEFIAREDEDKRKAKTPEERQLAKLKLNSIYGYTLKRGFRRLKRGKKGTWDTQLRKNTPIIDEIREDEHSFYVKNTYDLSFNYTALGVAILSETHRILYGLIARCDALGIPIRHVHTDSLLIPSSFVSEFPIDDQLGGIKVEYACLEASIVYSGKYRLTLENGEVVQKGHW
jgi:hypothetical protein